MQDTPKPDAPDTLPANLVFLRRLVTTLTAVMIVGVLVIIALLVIRLQDPTGPALPAEITLPDGTQPVAFTATRGWIAVVTDDDEILIYDRAGREILQRMKIEISD